MLSIDPRTALIVGAAVAMPMVVGEAAAAGIVVPRVVSKGHRAALASLAAPMLGIDAQARVLANKLGPEYATNYFHQLMLAAGETRGFIDSTSIPGTPGGLAVLTADEAAELAKRYLAAADAGRAVGDGAYDIADDTNAAGVSSGLSDAYHAINVIDFSGTGVFGLDEVPAPDALTRRVLRLALAMDTAGVDETHGGVDIVGLDFWENLSTLPGRVASRILGGAAGVIGGAAGDAVGSLLLSTPVLLLAGGALLYLKFGRGRS